MEKKQYIRPTIENHNLLPFTMICGSFSGDFFIEGGKTDDPGIPEGEDNQIWGEANEIRIDSWDDILW